MKRSSARPFLPIFESGFSSFFILGLILLLFILGFFSYRYLVQNSTPTTSTLKHDSKKTYRIGVIQDASNLQPAYDGFITGLEKQGLHINQNLKIEQIVTTADNNKSKEAFLKYVKEDVDLIVTIGTGSTLVAKQQNKSLHKKVVFFIVGDPIGNGIVDSFQSPGGDFTGVDSAQNRSAPKRLALLKEIAPKIKKVLFFYNNPNNNGLDELRIEAQKEGIELVERKVETVDELDTQLNSISAKEFDAVFRAADSISASRVDKLIAFSIQNKVPYSGTQWGDTQKGGLISYGPNYDDIGIQAASLAEKILAGINPADIPVEQPDRQNLSINLKTAELLGLTVPEELMRKAEKVVR